MAVIERSSNAKENDTRWGGNWRPTAGQVILGGLGLGSLGFGLGNLFSGIKFGQQTSHLATSAKIMDKLGKFV